jgi:hypothetical protein
MGIIILKGLRMKNQRLRIVSVFLLLVTSMLYADITGTVFQDLPVNGSAQNSYGQKDSNELGVAGIKVEAFNSAGSSVGNTTTGSDGSYTLTTAAGNYRVEFSNIPSYLKESVNGGVNNSLVRFASDGDSVDLGLHNPADYFASSTVDMVSSVHSGSIHIGNEFVLVKFSETAGSDVTDSVDAYMSPAPTVVAKENQIGAIWGLAYDRYHKQVYSGAFVKSLLFMNTSKGLFFSFSLTYPKVMYMLCLTKLLLSLYTLAFITWGRSSFF